MQSRKKIMVLALLMVLALTLFALLCCGCSPAEEPDGGPGSGDASPAGDEKKDEEEDDEAVSLTYLGHATFVLENEDGKVLIDPYNPQFGTYGRIDMEADVVTISHEHDDHNYAAGGGDDAVVLRGLTSGGDWNEVEYHLGETRIYNVGGTLHGRGLGRNSIFVFDTPSLRLVHLGDLGHLLTDDQINFIGNVDVLMIPVDGYYTIPRREIIELITRISPSVVIPIHYLTVDNEDSNLATLDDFLSEEIPYSVKKKGSTLTLSAMQLPGRTEVWTMDYTRPRGAD
ncbi:MAG: MBL fold metallo-hydrolase [Firmicutes bacterium]|nr:MBL fold metallo-hydrolase [Bacillota bacterium]